MHAPEFTAERGRRFALTLAAAFAVLGALALWRERTTTASVFGSLAVLFLLAALLVPGRLESVERAWMGVAHLISRVTTPIFMAIVYFVILTPVGVVRRIAGANPIIHRLSGDGYWIRRVARDRDKARRQMERQF